jgi:hypothetical protein
MELLGGGPPYCDPAPALVDGVRFVSAVPPAHPFPLLEECRLAGVDLGSIKTLNSISMYGEVLLGSPPVGPALEPTGYALTPVNFGVWSSSDNSIWTRISTWVDPPFEYSAPAQVGWKFTFPTPQTARYFWVGHRGGFPALNFSPDWSLFYPGEIEWEEA